MGKIKLARGTGSATIMAAGNEVSSAYQPMLSPACFTYLTRLKSAGQLWTLNAPDPNSPVVMKVYVSMLKV